MKLLKPETIAAQAGGYVDEATGAIVPPIHLSTTYLRDADNEYRRGYCYGRSDNATVRRAEEVLTQLEDGAATLLFGSGMTAAVMTFLALERPAHIIAPNVMYWGLRRWLAEEGPAAGVEATFVDTSDIGAVRRSLQKGKTKLIWIETPANPLWTITDIGAVAALAEQIGALFAVDSTVPTPVLTRPIVYGADIVVHSASKYLNGHSDVIAGASVFAKKDGTFEQAARLRTMMGGILGPFEAALLLRGMRTLHVRVRHQCESASILARHFSKHPKVEAVLYPGLETHPGHALAKRQMAGGFGGMLSLTIAGGEYEAISVAARTKLWKRATSLGGVESLIEHRASIEGEGSPCPQNLLRLSVGLENVADLIDDLESAMWA